MSTPATSAIRTSSSSFAPSRRRQRSEETSTPGAWATSLPITEVVEVGDVHLYVLHDLAALDLDPKAAGFDAVISGHSHRPAADVRDGVLYLNPGSAGPRRFNLPTTMARLEIAGDRLSHELVELVQS